MIDTHEDQNEFVDRMVHNGKQCLRPYPPDLARLDPLPERLDTFVFSLFSELEGAGGLPQYRLSPKGRPDVNLIDHHLHDTWPNVDDDNADVRSFLQAVKNALQVAQKGAAGGCTAEEAMRFLGLAVFLTIEDGYELRPQFFTDDEYVGEGADVAPGLVDAFQARWNRT